MPVRRLFRQLVIAAATGALLVAVAWGGASLAPVAAPNVADAAVDAAPRFEVGAAKVSMRPDPAAYGGTWETEGCATMEEDADLATATHLADSRVRWPEKPGCIYMGGYGLGPMNPITTWNDEYGLWVRTVAISDGTDTAVLTILDGTSYFADYNSMCDDCGAVELGNELGQELGFDPAGFMLVSTHSHTAPDFIGGWGGVPDWYMEQIADAIRTSVRDAIATMQPAVIETGEVMARRYNNERRDFYRSAEDNAMSWLRAYVPATPPGGRPSPAQTIATIGAYAAHPVTADESSGRADGDFPVVFDTRVEEAFGGVGLFLQTGLGNMSPRGSTEEMGNGLAALVPPVGAGQPLMDGDVRVARTFWDQPVTNSGLAALGSAGLFDRPFSQQPAAVVTGKNRLKPCTSTSPVSVNTSVSAIRVGELTITGAPGETFSNLANTVEEKAPGVALPLAQVNDGLGYIIQSFETDHAGRQAVGFVGEVAEYEDAYSLDHCFGDKVLEETLRLVGAIHAD